MHGSLPGLVVEVEVDRVGSDTAEGGVINLEMLLTREQESQH